MAAASGAGNLGVALAPFISGWLIANRGFEVMGTVVISTLSIVVLLSVTVGWHINQKLKQASASSTSPNLE